MIDKYTHLLKKDTKRDRGSQWISCYFYFIFNECKHMTPSISKFNHIVF